MRRLAIAILVFLPLAASAQTTNVWKGPTNGAAWSVAGNWSAGTSPTLANVAVFSTNSPFSGSNTTCIADGNWSVAGLVITGYSGTVTMPNSSNNTITNDFIQRTGTVVMNSSTCTVGRSHLKTGGTRTVGTSLLVLNGTGTFTQSGRDFYQLQCAFSNQTTIFNAGGQGGQARLSLMGGVVSNAATTGSIGANVANLPFTALPGSTVRAAGDFILFCLGNGGNLDIGTQFANCTWDLPASAIAITLSTTVPDTTWVFTNCSVTIANANISFGSSGNPGSALFSNSTFVCRRFVDFGSNVVANASSLTAQAVGFGTIAGSRFTATNCVFSMALATSGGFAPGASNVWSFTDVSIVTTNLTTGTIALPSTGSYTFTRVGLVASGAATTITSGGAVWTNATFNSPVTLGDSLVAATLSNSATLTTQGMALTSVIARNAGTLVASNSTLTIDQELSNSGVFSQMTSTVQFNVSTANGVLSNVPTLFNLVLAHPGKTVNIISNVTVLGTLSVQGTPALPAGLTGPVTLTLSNLASLFFATLSNVTFSGDQATIYPVPPLSVTNNVTGSIRILPAHRAKHGVNSGAQ